jgi:hypothetical protein
MCGRFDTSHLAWREVHDALTKFIPVGTAPLNLEARDQPWLTSFGRWSRSRSRGRPGHGVHGLGCATRGNATTEARARTFAERGRLSRRFRGS